MHFDGLTRRALAGAFACVLATAFLTACNRGSLRDSLTYCNYLADHLDELAKPPATAADVDAEVAFFNTIESKAPVAVDEQWQQLAALIREAATVNVDDVVARQKLANNTYVAERSMKEISDHAGAVCGLVLPNVGSITPSSPIPAPPSTATLKTAAPKPAATG